jgi:GrpB-like predicted nucleotidyltransferase (UPF0157 family)
MIEIVPYRPTWRNEFATIGAAMREAPGGLALRIDHIGSTSVPGLAAKDVIDIQVTVARLDAPVEDALNRERYRRLEHINRDHKPSGSTNAQSTSMRELPAEPIRGIRCCFGITYESIWPRLRLTHKSRQHCRGTMQMMTTRTTK